MADQTPPKDLTGLHDLPPLGFDPIGMPIMPELPQTADAPESATLPELLTATEVSPEPLLPKNSSDFSPITEFEQSDAMPTSEPISLREPELPANVLSRLVRYSGKDVGSSRDPLLVTLKIRGQVGPLERDRLLRLLSEHELGMSAQDLDVQIKSGRMLIPRINEYAATRIVQELRDSSLEFSVQDVDQEDEQKTPQVAARFSHARTQTEAPKSSLEDVRICDRSDLLETEEVFDLLEIPHTIGAQTVSAGKKDQYDALLGRVRLELKSRARIKGAHAIVDYQTTLDPLKDPAHYMLTVRGYLVRYRAQ